MKVLRSFDINTPGTSSENLIGGVLGGSITGSGCINIEDELEIRPGLYVDAATKKQKRKKQTDEDGSNDESECFKVQPLSCHVKGLMTGKTSLNKATKGGLVAIRTTLCPSTCANNGFVGAVVGLPGTLPPVWGPTLLLEHLELINIGGSSKKEKERDVKDVLKKGTIVRCHVGPTVVKGEVVRVSKSKRKLQLALKVPVVASKGAMVAIQAKTMGNENFALVAHGRIFGGDKCLDGADIEAVQQQEDTDPSKNVLKGTVPDLEEEEHHRKRFLDELETCNKISEDSLSNSKISVPRALVERDGGAHVCVQNFGSICLSLRRDPQHLISYLEKEGNLSCFLATEGSAIRVKWRSPIGTFPDRFTSILKRYAKAYIVCHQCHMAQTELRREDGNRMELLCRKCNARRFV